MFTGQGTTVNAFRRAVKNKVVSRPKSGVASGADHA